MKRILFYLFITYALSACIATDNPTVQGLGTPDITACGIVPAEDGYTYTPQRPALFNARLRPDVFYIGWSQLDSRNDLRFPTSGYDPTSGINFEDKLFVSRELPDGTTRTWQLLPKRNVDCTDANQVRIHSFDVAPDGKSLYVSMRQGTDTHLGIYQYYLNTHTFTKISLQNNTHFVTPTYIGDDPITGHPMLFVSKSVTDAQIPVNYRAVLRDEYDRQPTTLIHKMDAVTGDVFRIGFNNSHQQDPVLITHNGLKTIVFTQWEHQSTTNRFSLWKMQVDGSDNFTFFGQESSTDKSARNLSQPREIKSGPYAGYTIMMQGSRVIPNTALNFAAEGDIVMTKRVNLDLRSDRVVLESSSSATINDNISRNPEHYNAESFVYAYRPNKDFNYNIYTKDFLPLGQGTRKQISPVTNFYHFVQPRSYYPPATTITAPTNGTLGQGRTSFTNTTLAGRSGFLVQNLLNSQNGVQHQLLGTLPKDISLQFFIPSQHFNNSNAIANLITKSPELSVPASGFIVPEADGSIAAITKPGLYVWKVNKRFNLNGANIWIPIRAERQEVSFIPNRVNACNQCHQERSQANVNLYQNYHSTAETKMLGNLMGVTDISTYNAVANVPDYHTDIVPLFNTPSAKSGMSCASCHNSGSQLNLSNSTGIDSQVPSWLALLGQAHTVSVTGQAIPYINDLINPMGIDNRYHPAPFLWSLLLNDDLTVPADGTHPNNASRTLERAGDYGAVFDLNVLNDIKTINAQYDHSTHWTAAQTQAFITYSTTQSRVGLSDRIQFTPSSLAINTAAAQRAYQVMLRQCFSCHSDSKASITSAFRPIESVGLGLPLKKTFIDATKMKNRDFRFVMKGHIPYMTDTVFSPLLWQSDLTTAMSNTLQSSRRRIDFSNISSSELLKYATGTGLDNTVSHPAVLVQGSADYNDLYTWASGGTNVNQAPTLIQPIKPIVIREYDAPKWIGPIDWVDADGDLAQLKMRPVGGINDSMLAFDYYSFTQASILTYAILGDRGSKAFEFIVTDGLDNPAIQTIPVEIYSDYNVPPPQANLPNFYSFYTVKVSNELRMIDQYGTDTLIGVIPANTSTWATVYRRSDKGWLFFNDQAKQTIYVVDEKNANVLARIILDHAPNADRIGHKQTNYLLWWRPADPYTGNPGELQGMLESKLTQFPENTGDFYIGLIDAYTLDTAIAGSAGTVVDITRVPEWRTKMSGTNYISAYVWRNATFMTQLVNQGVDELYAINLITGKQKQMTGGFTFVNDPNKGYQAMKYFNVRATVVAEDGAFYGFNLDINQQLTAFNFDPIAATQIPVPIPVWLQNYMLNIQNYATPFLVIDPRP